MGISRVCVFDDRSHAFILLTSASLKANILIDQTGRARLADFGLVTIISDCSSLLSSSSHTQGGTARWMSPELIDPQRFGFEKGYRTKLSDCYAFGMVVYETLSGRSPFYQHADLTVVMKVLEGERPTRGPWFAGSLWGMLKLCWAPQSSNRPSIEDVFRCLERVRTLSEPPSPGADEETEGYGDDWDSTDDSPRMSSHFIPLQRSTVSVRGSGNTDAH
jgi:serine/threonine protein kinase